MSHGSCSSTVARRLTSTRTTGSWLRLSTTNVWTNIGGGGIRGSWRSNLPLCFHRGKSRWNHKRKALPLGEPILRASPPTRTSTSSQLQPQQHNKPPKNPKSTSPVHLSRSKEIPPEDPSFKISPLPRNEDYFPPWQDDPAVEDPGLRLRRIVRDAGLAFSNSMYGISKTTAGYALAKEHRNPAGLAVHIQRRQVIHPYSMRFLLDKQHTYEKLTLRRYMEKKPKEPFWWFVILFGDKDGFGGAYVRSTMVRRVEMAWRVALKRRGFDPHGWPLADAEGWYMRTRPLKGSVKFFGHFTKVLEMTVEEIAECMVHIVDVLVQELDGSDDEHKGTRPGNNRGWRRANSFRGVDSGHRTG